MVFLWFYDAFQIAINLAPEVRLLVMPASPSSGPARAGTGEIDRGYKSKIIEKTMGKPWENGKTIGKWENHRKMGF